MATFDYNAMQDTADQLLTEFGVVGRIRRYTGSFDPVAGQRTASAYVETDAKMVSLPSNNFLVSFDETIDAQIKRIGRVFILSSKGLGFEPVVGDLVKFGDEVLEAIGPKPLNPAGTPLLNYVGCITSGETWLSFKADISKWGKGLCESDGIRKDIVHDLFSGAIKDTPASLAPKSQLEANPECT